MTDCPCLENSHDETMDNINMIADVLSSAFIIAILEKGLCGYAGTISAGRMMACVAARLGDMEERIDGINLLKSPQTRHTLELMVAHARNETEENLGAHN